VKDGDSPHPAYRGCSHAKEELQRRKNQRTTNQESSGRTFFSKNTMPERSFASVLRSPVEEKQKESAGPQKQQVTNKTSGQSIQADVNNNAMDDMYVAFTMVQQIMTEF
jgi:sRNA-binding protein